jgi:hypothetical protein
MILLQESSRDAHRAVLARIRGRPTDEVVSPAEIFICSPLPPPPFLHSGARGTRSLWMDQDQVGAALQERNE